MKTAVVGSDLSKASDLLVGNAGEFRLLGIEKVHLLYVLNRRDVDDFSIFNSESTEAGLERQKRLIEESGFECETKVVLGPPANELIKEARVSDAGLIVVGSRGNSSTSETIGATASETLHRMKCPVLLVVLNKDPEPDIRLLHPLMNEHVLFATDFSDFSENAFRYLKELPGPFPQLTLMHIQDVVRITPYLDDKLGEFNQIDTTRLERLKEEFIRIHPETKVRVLVDYGHPKQLIPRFIRNNNVSLTVMGSQGRGYIGEFFLGSVSLRVARHAESNLLIVPFNKR